MLGETNGNIWHDFKDSRRLAVFDFSNFVYVRTEEGACFFFKYKIVTDLLFAM